MVMQERLRDIPFPFPFHGPVQIFSPPEKVTRVLDQILVDVGDEPQKLFKAERQSRHKNHHHRKTPLRMNAFFFKYNPARASASRCQSRPIQAYKSTPQSGWLPCASASSALEHGKSISSQFTLVIVMEGDKGVACRSSRGREEELLAGHLTTEVIAAALINHRR